MQLRSSQNESNSQDLNNTLKKTSLGLYQAGLFENRRTILNGFKADSLKPKLIKIQSALKQNNIVLGKKRGRNSKKILSIQFVNKPKIITRMQLRSESSIQGNILIYLIIYYLERIILCKINKFIFNFKFKFFFYFYFTFQY